MLIGLSLSGITRLAHKTITAKNKKSKGTIRQLVKVKNKIINSGYTYDGLVVRICWSRDLLCH